MSAFDQIVADAVEAVYAHPDIDRVTDEIGDAARIAAAYLINRYHLVAAEEAGIMPPPWAKGEQE